MFCLPKCGENVILKRERVLYACVYLRVLERFVYGRLQNELTQLINCHTCVKMKTAPVKVIIRQNILTQISLNGPVLSNIRKLTNAELEPLKTIGI